MGLNLQDVRPTLPERSGFVPHNRGADFDPGASSPKFTCLDGFAEGRRRTAIGGPECIVKAPHAAKTGSKSNVTQRHCRLIDQPLRRLYASRRSNIAWARAGMMEKQP
jgi:hypothetical protein